MITRSFDFQAPAGLGEALRLLAADPDGARPLSGGMTLVPMMTLGLVAPERLIDLKGVPELAGIREEPDAVVVGATTTHHEIATALLVREHAPLLADAAALVGDVQVRNRGTIGGSVAHADPAANYLPALLALDAAIEALSPRGGLLRRDAARSRRVPASEFFAGLMTTALKSGEIVGAVRIPKRTRRTGAAFRKFARVKGNFPIVCAAALVHQEASGSDRSGCVAIGGATAVPVRIDLSPMPAWPASEVEAAIRSAIDDPMSDANGSAEYRVEMAAVHGRRAVQAACLALDGTQRNP